MHLVITSRVTPQTQEAAGKDVNRKWWQLSAEECLSSKGCEMRLVSKLIKTQAAIRLFIVVQRRTPGYGPGSVGSNPTCN